MHRTSATNRHCLECCAAQPVAAVGHVRRIDGAGATSGYAPIATELTYCKYSSPGL